MRRGDYQIEAVEAAQITLHNRKLTDQQLNDVITFNISEQQKDQAEEEKKIALKNKVKHFGNFVTHTLNPIQQEKQSADKIIFRISVLFGGLFFYQLFSQFEVIKIYTY